ncbi:transcription initiation factor IIB family protein [Halorientalis pallida]|jgi:transcription initiation factor TFIIIB Brf1 subunit/transcription initiation factor TFIIB|uniref:Transcription factor TFIIB repeat-containing protein n=1 Tax=Halorientalis regularis TaxID=660518 RepID=A0A1G7MWV7_9EURY|nr:cyclin [Halorientalis regularis]SDF66192.1 Transcription factor TFIIB repeat-containing protein [Halorientalis regularis]
MYRASDEVDNEEWLAELEAAADRLDLDDEARTRAADLFLSTLPDSDRSKRPTMAASLYVATLVTSDRRAQGEVADAVGVSRLSVQQRWKELLERTGLDAPDW